MDRIKFSAYRNRQGTWQIDVWFTYPDETGVVQVIDVWTGTHSPTDDEDPVLIAAVLLGAVSNELGQEPLF